MREGEFRFGYPHGKIEVKYADGKSYWGCYRYGKRGGGFGVMTLKDGDKWEGQWSDGKLISGTHTMDNGIDFEGGRKLF